MNTQNNTISSNTTASVTPTLGDSSFILNREVIDTTVKQLEITSDCKLIFVEKGNGSIIAGNFIGQFKKGDLFYIPSNLPHLLKADLVSQRATVHSVSWKIGAYSQPLFSLPEMTDICSFYKGHISGIKLSGLDALEVGALMLHALELSGPSRLVRFIEILSRVKDSSPKHQMVLVAGERTDLDRQQDSNRMQTVIQYTLEHLDSNIDLEEISSVAAMTSTSFCRYFKKQTSKTYIQYLNELRVQRVCELLLLKENSIAEIAYSCGFRNLSHFNTIFKNVVGKTPREYRNEIASSVF